MTLPERAPTRASFLAFSLLLAACAGGEPAPADVAGARLDLHVGALSLPGVGRVCYDVRVESGASETVWSRGVVGTSAAGGDTTTICSDAYGDGAGGGVAYVGTCDASAPEHTVRLWIDSIEDENGAPLTDWRDPCPPGQDGAPGGCTKPAHCDANADTAVTFDLTVMRAANQGFFDVAVEFDDIFCSAKLDCAYDDAGEEPIELLFRDGVRSQTAVVGFACTGGPGGAGTILYASDISVACGTPGSVSLAASIAYATLEDGSAVGFEVHQGSAGPPTLVPMYWERTGADTWATGVAAPTGSFTSGELLWPLGPNRVAGPSFDTSNPEGGSGLTVWQRSGGAWSIETTIANTALGASHVRYDAAHDRLWIGDSAAALVSYWDIGSEVVNLPSIEGAQCAVHDFSGDLAIGDCGGGPTMFDAGAGSQAPLPLPAGVPTASSLTRGAVLSDGSFLGVLQQPAATAILVRWTYDGVKSWLATTIVDDGAAGMVMDWAESGYVAVTAGAGQQTLYRADGSGGLDSWATGTLDGGATAGFHLNGVVVGYDSAPIVVGVAEKGGEGVPAAGVLGATATAIALQELPLTTPIPNLQAMGGFGVDAGGDLWIVGGDPATFYDLQGVAGSDDAVWRVHVAGAALVVDDHVALDADAVSMTDFFGHTFAPLRAVTAISGTTIPEGGGGVASAFEPFAGGSSATPLAATPLASPLGPAATVAHLDPTVTGNGWTTDPDPTDGVWGYAIYRGSEALQCDGVSCDKLYWNAAVGFDPAVDDCTLHFEATATDAPGFPEGATPAGARYPVIVFDAPLTAGGAVVCRKDGLDDGSGHVVSTYTPADTPTTFCYGYNGEEAVTSPSCSDAGF
ncbi:MAG: hypothetical protein KC635_12365 [Myxococcales bacterium]|nr:hypothetical protein [Myxococcales bacterium]MCB9737438.1 hypothetical protein [Deltaproteobacteria bacterium]